MQMETSINHVTSKRYPHFPGAKQGSPGTSFAAARSVAKSAKSKRAAALAFVERRGEYGATADEVAIGSGWEQIYSSRPRLSELVKARLIVSSGRYRRGVSGRWQMVWVARHYVEAHRQPTQASLWDYMNA